MVRDIRYILKRVIIGVLIGLFFIMFKSCDVKALTYIEGATANVYLQSQYCEEGETITTTSGNSTFTGNRFTCTKGPSYKFVQYLNSDNNVSVPALFNEKQLINNFTFEINFEDTQTITSTNRYIVLRAPWISSNVSDNSISTFEYFTLNGIKNGSTVSYSPSVSTFFARPQYCNYSDGTNLYSCSVKLAAYTSLNRYLYYIDIPVGSSVKSITLFLGNNNIQSTYDLFTDKIVNDFRAMTPTIWSRYNCTSSSSSTGCYGTTFSAFQSNVSQNYNVYGANTFSGAGLIYYRYTPDNSTFIASNRTDNLFFESSVPTTSITYNYSSYSQEQVDYYNNLVNNIDIEMNPQPSNDSFFEDFLEGFTTSSQASGFISLFNDMFLYPLQKLQTNAQVDLVRDNIHGDKILSNFLCMQNSEPGLLGSYVPYKVQFFRDYKFTLPCPHTEIYNKLYYGEYGFYGNNFKGAEIRTGISYSFAEIWLILQHGFLVYILFVNCLNVYKYVLDSNKTEVEVLEL